MMNRQLWLLPLLVALTMPMSGCVALVAGGVAGATMVASDPRSNGAYVDDKAINSKAAALISQQLPTAHVNITSYNRAVLMTGEVPTDSAQKTAQRLVGSVPNVRRVFNYTVVATPSTFGQRNEDAWITSKVRGHLISVSGSTDVKVVTERSVVYLLGLIPEKQAQAVIDAVSKTSGVKKVVPLFEYVLPVPKPSDHG